MNFKKEHRKNKTEMKLDNMKIGNEYFPLDTNQSVENNLIQKTNNNRELTTQEHHETEHANIQIKNIPNTDRLEQSSNSNIYLFTEDLLMETENNREYEQANKANEVYVYDNYKQLDSTYKPVYSNSKLGQQTPLANKVNKVDTKTTTNHANNILNIEKNKSSDFFHKSISKDISNDDNFNRRKSKRNLINDLQNQNMIIEDDGLDFIVKFRKLLIDPEDEYTSTFLYTKIQICEQCSLIFTILAMTNAIFTRIMAYATHFKTEDEKEKTEKTILIINSIKKKINFSYKFNNQLNY